MQTKKQIQKLSAEELASCRQNSTATKPEPQTETKPTLSKYISRLSLKEVRDFFSPFGVGAVAKFPSFENPQFIYVCCNDFEITFSDYEYVVKFNDIPAVDPDVKFNLIAFRKYCDDVNKTPEEVLITKVATEFMGRRFDSYAEDKKKFDMNNANKAYDALPKSLRTLFAGTREKVEADIISEYNKTTYGSFNIEENIKRNGRY